MAALGGILSSVQFSNTLKVNLPPTDVQILQIVFPPPDSMNQTSADRKQKKKLSQQLQTLSAMVPGLNTTEEDSVLRGSMKYMKDLQEKVKVLEAQAGMDDESSSHSTNQTVLDIKAKISGNNVLIRIHCEKQRIVSKAVAEIEKLNLTVTNSSIMSFGNSAQEMTIVAQMDKEFHKTQEDIVRELSLSFRQFM